MEYGNPHYSQILNIMKRQMLFKKVFTATLFCCTLWNTACVNQIEEEIQESDVPIIFSAKKGKNATKVVSSTFNKGDNVGLFAMLNPTNYDDEPYINNLHLECGDNSTLIPEKTVFYPEGNLPLDFISYYPYQPELQQKEAFLIPVSVKTNQSDTLKYTQSDFLIAKRSKVENSAQAVELEYQHKLTKIKIVLTPGKDENIQDMLKANPKIVATGIKTKANYNLKNDSFSDLDCTADIIAFGKWTIKEGTLIGKEIIIIPQELNAENQSFTIDWNGRLYSCSFPNLDKQEESECEIDISAMQTSSNILEGIVGKITDWETGTGGKTDNLKEYATIHLSALSFAQSNVYRIYYNGKPVAEICKEYLNSKNLSSTAIVVYPVFENEKTDQSEGIVLQLLDINDAINGGKIHWDTDTSFTYQNGNSAHITQFYLNAKKEIILNPTDDIINVNIISYTLRDIRNGVREDYPIVKVGTQYWMREDLHVTSYQDGTPIQKLKKLGKDPGYFKAEDYDLYFYNGEAISLKKVSPLGWRIPAEKDWKRLNSYITEDASLLKAGKWQFAGTGTGEITPAENRTMLSIYPSGMWFQDHHANIYKTVGFWSWDETNNKIPEQTAFFMGQSNKIIMDKTIATDHIYYKALSIRCIKE